MFIEDQVDNINENDDFLSEDKEMTNWMKSIEDKLNIIQTENSSIKKEHSSIKKEHSSIKKENSSIKKENSFIKKELTQHNTRIDSLETVTAKPFVLNICTQILKHISGVKFETSTKSHYFSRNKKDKNLSSLLSYVKSKYKTKDFCRRADKCIHERNEKFHPLSFDLLRNDAHDALKLLAQSHSLQNQFKFERIVLETVDDEDMVNAYFTV